MDHDPITTARTDDDNALAVALRAALRAPRNLAAGLLDAILPQTCVLCGESLPAEAGRICHACDTRVRAAMHLPYCPRCGRTLPSSAIHDDGCARCRTERTWNVAGVARASPYTPEIRALMLDLKYRGRLQSAEVLADLLAEALRRAAWPDRLDALVPVPMHWLRRLQRPCDHADVLVEALSRRTGVPVARGVRRVRYGPSQTRLPSKRQRFENIAGAFARRRGWMRRWSRGAVEGRTVCIVDNLVLSGATVHEMSKVLRQAGAKRIYALTIARPPAPGDPRVNWSAAAPSRVEEAEPSERL